MSDFLSYNEFYFNESVNKVKKAAEYMGQAVTNSINVISSIPNDFSDRSNVINSTNNIKDVCLAKDEITQTFDYFSTLVSGLEDNPDEGYLFDYGAGPKYVNFDRNFMVNVCYGANYSSDGTPFPIEQYVMGVIDAEQGRVWGSMCYNGELTMEQYLTATKAFAVMARSYGIAQTEFNFACHHEEDHKISDSGADKQAFMTRLFDYNDPQNTYKKGWSMYTTVTLAAALETTGIVIGNNDQPLSTYYTAGKNEKIIEYAKQGLDYISILRLMYPDKFTEDTGLKYYDYKSDKIIGDVSSDTEISELIGINLSDKPSESVPTQWTYQLTDKGRSSTVINPALNNGTPYTSEINFNESTLDQATRLIAPPKLEAVGATTMSAVGGKIEQFGENNVYANLGSEVPKQSVFDSLGIPKEATLVGIAPAWEKIISGGKTKEATANLNQSNSTVNETTTPKTLLNQNDYNKLEKNSDTLYKKTFMESREEIIKKAIEPVSVLPENKFSNELPNIKKGNLDSVELSSSHANYNVSDVSDDVYNDYVSKLKETGYSLESDGKTWIKDNYTVNLTRNDTDLNIYFEEN